MSHLLDATAKGEWEKELDRLLARLDARLAQRGNLGRRAVAWGSS